MVLVSSFFFCKEIYRFYGAMPISNFHVTINQCFHFSATFGSLVELTCLLYFNDNGGQSCQYAVCTLHGPESFFEKLVAPQPVKKFPICYRTQIFTTMARTVHHLSLSQDIIDTVQALSNYFLNIYFNIIALPMPRSSKCFSVSQVSLQKPLCNPPLPHT